MASLEPRPHISYAAAIDGLVRCIQEVGFYPTTADDFVKHRFLPPITENESTKPLGKFLTQMTGGSRISQNEAGYLSTKITERAAASSANTVRMDLQPMPCRRLTCVMKHIKRHAIRIQRTCARLSCHCSAPIQVMKTKAGHSPAQPGQRPTAKPP